VLLIQSLIAGHQWVGLGLTDNRKKRPKTIYHTKPQRLTRDDREEHEVKPNCCKEPCQARSLRALSPSFEAINKANQPLATLISLY
jgi:hypothetical protein